MELVSPEIGLIFWMTLAFLLLLFLLGKFAWKPVLKVLRQREEKITEALNEAHLAKEQMKQLMAENERSLAQAKDNRDAILVEARKVSQKMYDDAKARANEEGQRIITAAKESIAVEKQKTIADIRNLVAELSLEIAEDVIRRELSDRNRYNEYVSQRVNEITLN